MNDTLNGDNSGEEIVSDGTAAHYFLAKGYKYRDKVDHFDDRANKARWQDYVYATAHRVLTQNHGLTVLDIGCGSGFKLMKYFSGFETIGIERSETVPMLQATYPERKWLTAEDNDTPFPPADIYICSDVIEHIRHPDRFLARIAASPFQNIVISTPAREVLFADGRREFLNPPENKHHHFEWTMGEFQKFICQYFYIQDHFFNYNATTAKILLLLFFLFIITHRQ